MKSLRTLALILLPATLAPAQHTAVDFPDSTLATPAELLFPLYTIGGGGVVRYQTICPATFQGLPTQPMLVTGVGLQIAGQELYDRFEIRFGTTPHQTPASCWDTNLPDQRVQSDQSNTVLQGGLQAGNPVNRWVEYPLAFPFVWNPGDSLALDIVASAAVPGSWCLTASGTHPRVYLPYYSNETCGAVDPTSGIKFRIVFEPIGFPTFGTACTGTGGFAPAIGGSGSTQLGGQATVQLSNALGGAPTFVLFGFSRTAGSFGPLPFGFGGGCDLLTSMELNAPVHASGSAPGQGTASYALSIPNVPALRGGVLFAQFVQLDTASPAVLPFTTSDALALVVH